MDSSAPLPTTTPTAEMEMDAAPISSLPSGQPIDSSAPPPPPPKKIPMSDLLAAGTSNLDAFLARLHRCAQTRAGADVILFFLTYATRLSGNLLETLSRAALRNSASKLVALALQLPPSTMVTFTSAPIASPVISIALRLAARLKAAAAMLSEVRTFGRLWGLLGLYFAAKKLLLSRKAAKEQEEKNSDEAAESRFDTFVAAAQILSLISFQASENVVYLTSKKILNYSPSTTAKLTRWSSRSWALYVGIELARLLIVRQRRVAAAGGYLTAKDAEWSAGWKKDFLRNLAWSPITVHYSFDIGLLNDLAISALAFYPGASAMKELWEANA